MKCRKWPDRGCTPTSGRSHSGDIAISVGGQVALAHQAVLAVEVGDDRLQQVGALDQARGDRWPLALVDQHGDVAQRPGALGLTSVAVLAEEHAGIAQVLVAAGEARACEFLRRQRAKWSMNGRQTGRTLPCGVEQLVGDAGQGPVAGEQPAPTGLRCACRLSAMTRGTLCIWLRLPARRRRSSVMREFAVRRLGARLIACPAYVHAARSAQAGAPRPRCR